MKGGRLKAAGLYPVSPERINADRQRQDRTPSERNNKVRKHISVALVSVVIAGFCYGTASAQQPGSPRGVKPKKPQTTTTSSAVATQPARPGGTQPAARPRPGTPAAAPSPQASAKGNATGFKEVSKEKFKEIYFRLGGGKRAGWTADYWQEFFEDKVKPGWKFMVEEPRSPKHVRMFIVTDAKAKEYRLFFMTEESEEESEWPGKR
ncbi:MAG: hypothetical protein QOG71_1736 [Pyrinomonadaceae bacterium]|nr:hypothetical protein [Pyrinomonadaceae bacterium]